MIIKNNKQTERIFDLRMQMNLIAKEVEPLMAKVEEQRAQMQAIKLKMKNELTTVFPEIKRWENGFRVVNEDMNKMEIKPIENIQDEIMQLMDRLLK